MRRESGNPSRDVGDLVGQILSAELGRRDIDRDPDVVRPLLGLGAGGFKDPVADLADKTALLGYRDEFRRGNEPALWMRPPDQCFAAHNLAGS